MKTDTDMNKSEALLDEFLTTLMSSWGGDAPPEAFWVMTDFVNWVNEAFNQDFSLPAVEEYTDEYEDEIQEIIKGLTETIAKDKV